MRGAHSDETSVLACRAGLPYLSHGDLEEKLRECEALNRKSTRVLLSASSVVASFVSCHRVLGDVDPRQRSTSGPSTRERQHPYFIALAEIVEARFTREPLQSRTLSQA